MVPSSGFYTSLMPRRRAGVLLPVEEAILAVGLRCLYDEEPEFYGFAIAELLADGADAGRLLGHGTLYKALGRLEQGGLLESRWEDIDARSKDGRDVGSTASPAMPPPHSLIPSSSNVGGHRAAGEAGRRHEPCWRCLAGVVLAVHPRSSPTGTNPTTRRDSLAPL